MPSLRARASYLPWTNGNNLLPSLNDLSLLCRKRLISIGIELHGVYTAMLNEVQRKPADRNGSRFDDEEVRRVTAAASISFKTDLGSSEGKALLSTLADDSYLCIWQKVANALLEHQGQSKESELVPWQQAKLRARYFLDRRSTILDLFEDIKEEIMMHRPDVYRGILGKLSNLQLFLVVYDRQPSRLRGFEPMYTLRERKSQRSILNAYTEAEYGRNPTLVAVVCLGVCICIIPVVLAWRSADDIPGSMSDVDFWLLVQNSTLQLLGIFVSIFPIYRKSFASGWIWTWVFAVIGSICAVTAVPLYLYAPTIWSASISYLGSAAQAYMGLQLALLVDSSLLRGSTGQRQDRSLENNMMRSSNQLRDSSRSTIVRRRSTSDEDDSEGDATGIERRTQSTVKEFSRGSGRQRRSRQQGN